jgi:hypothetical protein
MKKGISKLSSKHLNNAAGGFGFSDITNAASKAANGIYNTGAGVVKGAYDLGAKAVNTVYNAGSGVINGVKTKATDMAYDHIAGKAVNAGAHKVEGLLGDRFSFGDDQKSMAKDALSKVMKNNVSLSDAFKANKFF